MCVCLFICLSVCLFVCLSVCLESKETQAISYRAGELAKMLCASDPWRPGWQGEQRGHLRQESDW
jgi:hypothetical protein